MPILGDTPLGWRPMTDSATSPRVPTTDYGLQRPPGLVRHVARHHADDCQGARRVGRAGRPVHGPGWWQSPGTVNDPTHANSYQALIVDRSDTGWGNFDVVFNYDSITWQYEYNGINSSTGAPIYSYSKAGWSRGIPGEEYEFVWRGEADGRLDDHGEPMMYPEDQLPYPQDHWFPQHDDYGHHVNLSTFAKQDRRNESQFFPEGSAHFFHAGAAWHIALVLDGRVMVAAEGFAAQVEAIAAGLDDQVAFPRDERFAISVTMVGRYRDQDTHSWIDGLTIFLGWTILCMPTMATLQGRIRASCRRRVTVATTASGLGVAVDHTESFLSPNALRSVCQVGFDQPSSGLVY